MNLEIKTKNIHKNDDDNNNSNNNNAIIRANFNQAKDSQNSPLLNSPLVIIIHGFKGFKDWGFFPFLSAELNKKRISTLQINFSHNGVGKNLFNFDQLDKFKDNSFSQEAYEIEQIFNYIVQDPDNTFQNVDKKRISLLGHSRGAYSTIVAGSRVTIEKAITLAGISSLPDISPEQEAKWREDGQHLIENSRTNQMMPLGLNLLEDILSKKEFFNQSMKNFSKPLLIIHGDKDPTVPLESALKLNKTVKGSTLETIENANHVFNVRHPFKNSSPELDRAIKRVISFLT